MNTVLKDIKRLTRSPLNWLILAVVSFMLAWVTWQMIDRYDSLQASFSALPNPPNITNALWVPYVLTLAKAVILMVALTAGYSIAQERSQGTFWYLIINEQSFFKLVIAKFKAQLVLLIFILLQLFVTTWLLFTGGELNWPQVAWGTVGLMLFSMWLIALGQLFSAYCQSTGTAVLFNVVVFVLLWMLGGDVVSEEYGLNWLHLLSPVIHLKWFCEAEVNLSSVIYFVFGIGLFMWLTTQQIKKMRLQL